MKNAKPFNRWAQKPFSECWRTLCRPSLVCFHRCWCRTSSLCVWQNRSSELVTPRRLARGQLEWVRLSTHFDTESTCAASPTVCVCFRVQLEGEGTYECSVTGLVFEASERVLVRYSVLSWSKYSSFLRDSWKFAGPIFNVDTVPKDAPALTSIQFPHSVCLAGENDSHSCLFFMLNTVCHSKCKPWPVSQCYERELSLNKGILHWPDPLFPIYPHADPENEMTFSVLHIKNDRPLIEPTVDHSGSHVKWNVTSLSPVGPIIQTSQSVEHHGVVLVYKQQGSDNNSNSFHIYLATNSSSDIKVSTAGRCALLFALRPSQAGGEILPSVSLSVPSVVLLVSPVLLT